MKLEAIILVTWVLINVVCDCINEYKHSTIYSGKTSSGVGSILGVIFRYGSWAWLAYECGLRLGVNI